MDSTDLLLPYGLGRLPAEDERDRAFLMAAILTPEETGILPDRRYYRTGPVLDQGRTSSCVGHAWRQWLSSAPLMTRTGPDAFMIYHEAQKIDEWPGEAYDGTSVRGGAKYLHTQGHIREYRWAQNADDVATWILSNKGTVVLGTTWYYSMFTPDPKTGLVKIGGRTAGGHAYLCVGYSRPKGAFRCLNSWGARWGQAGKFWIDGEDLEILIVNQDGEAAAAIEAKK